jgi:hypothetical protein
MVNLIVKIMRTENKHISLISHRRRRAVGVRVSMRGLSQRVKRADTARETSG